MERYFLEFTSVDELSNAERALININEAPKPIAQWSDVWGVVMWTDEDIREAFNDQDIANPTADQIEEVKQQWAVANIDEATIERGWANIETAVDEVIDGDNPNDEEEPF